ncbi:MAG TPA: cobalamin-dependent protein [Acidimicrobiales bacterium]|nr:cobalamin-dependent protein [Acidimicrobiales bacterium]
MGTRPSGELNLKQVAAALEVHYMTAYRYVRTGRLAARRVGTGWVVHPADLAAFAARAAPGPDGPGDAGHDPAAAWRARLAGTLARGDEIAAWRVLEQALAAGQSPAQCYLDLVVGAIDDISGRSALPDAPAAQEYLAMATAARLVARLGARFRRPGRSRGTVVFGAALGEHHTLAISVVADLVRLEGFNCLELGADVPPEAFAGAAADAYRLVAVGIGVTTATNLDAVRATVDAVHGVDPAIPVVVGGQAANPATGVDTGADAWASDGRRAVELFDDLARARRRFWLVDDDRATAAAGVEDAG